MRNILSGLFEVIAVVLQTLLAIAVWFGIPIALFGGWLQHVVTCIQDENWLLLIVGALAFPIGIIHGIGIWFGWF